MKNLAPRTLITAILLVTLSIPLYPAVSPSDSSSSDTFSSLKRSIRLRMNQLWASTWGKRAISAAQQPVVWAGIGASLVSAFVIQRALRNTQTPGRFQKNINPLPGKPAESSEAGALVKPTVIPHPSDQVTEGPIQPVDPGSIIIKKDLTPEELLAIAGREEVFKGAVFRTPNTRTPLNPALFTPPAYDHDQSQNQPVVTADVTAQPTPPAQPTAQTPAVDASVTEQNNPVPTVHVTAQPTEPAPVIETTTLLAAATPEETSMVLRRPQFRPRRGSLSRTNPPPALRRRSSISGYQSLRNISINPDLIQTLQNQALPITSQPATALVEQANAAPAVAQREQGHQPTETHRTDSLDYFDPTLFDEPVAPALQQDLAPAVAPLPVESSNHDATNDINGTINSVVTRNLQTPTPEESGEESDGAGSIKEITPSSPQQALNINVDRDLLAGEGTCTEDAADTSSSSEDEDTQTTQAQDGDEQIEVLLRPGEAATPGKHLRRVKAPKTAKQTKKHRTRLPLTENLFEAPAPQATEPSSSSPVVHNGTTHPEVAPEEIRVEIPHRRRDIPRALLNGTRCVSGSIRDADLDHLAIEGGEVFFDTDQQLSPRTPTSPSSPDQESLTPQEAAVRLGFDTCTETGKKAVSIMHEIVEKHPANYSFTVAYPDQEMPETKWYTINLISEALNEKMSAGEPLTRDEKAAIALSRDQNFLKICQELLCHQMGLSIAAARCIKLAKGYHKQPTP